MKKLLSLSVMTILLGFASIVEADSEPGWGIQSIVLTERLWSKYVNVSGINMYNSPTLNNDIAVTLKNGLYGEIWHSKSLNDFKPSSNKGDEIDFTLAASKKIYSINLNAGIIYVDMIPLSRAAGDKLRIFLDVSKIWSFFCHQITPFVRYEWNQPLVGKTPVSGSWIWVGANDVWKIERTLLLKSKAYLLYDDTKKEGIDVILQSALSWSIAERFSLEPIVVRLYQPIWKSPDKKFEFVTGAGLTGNF